MPAKKPSGAGPQEQFAKLPRDLIRSDAWRSLGINERRFIDFLLLEHMSHGGRENGNLKAPWLQLFEFGVAKNFITAAIRDVEARGLVLCTRGGMRTMTRYAIAWLPLFNGAMPPAAWRDFRDPSLRPLPTPKIRNLPPKEGHPISLKRDKQGKSVPKEGQTGPKRGPKNVPERGVPSRIPLPRKDEGDSVSREVSAGEPALGADVVLFPGPAQAARGTPR